MEIEDCQRQFTGIIEGMGDLLPYRQRIQRLRLTTFLERKMSGDLFETFKIMNGLVNYGQNMFRKNSAHQTSNLPVIPRHELMNSFGIELYCNQPPLGVRSSAEINAFNAGLDRFKSSKPYSSGLWELSEQIFNRINNKSEYMNYYLLANCDVAMRQNILF